jgi:hypothetical protein
MSTSGTAPAMENPSGPVKPARPLDSENLGVRLAAPLKAMDIDAVVCWYRVEDATLAHVVGRELETEVLYAFDSEGLLSLVQGLMRGAKVVLVAAEFLYSNDLPGLCGVVKASGGFIKAVATGQAGLELSGTAAEGALLIDPSRQ